MTNSSIRNTFTLSSLVFVALFSLGAFANVVHAQEFGFSPDVGSGYGFSPDVGGCGACASPGYGFSPDVPNGYGFSPDIPNSGTSQPLGGTYQPLGGTYEQLGGTYQTLGGTYTAPSYGYGSTLGYSASLGYGYSSSPYYYPTSTYYPTSSFYPTSFAATSPSNTYAPTTISNPTTVSSPTSVYSPTSTYSPTTVATYSPTSTYAPTNTSTYAPTNTSTYAPTNTSTYAPTSYASSVYSPTSNPTSIYSPSDSHNFVGGTTVTTDSHAYTGPVTISVVSQAAPQNPAQYVSGGGSYFNSPTYYNTPNYNNTPTYGNTPTYFPPVMQAPSCTITASGGGYNLNYYGNGATVLTWTSTNANSGYITPLVGTVAPAGSTTVYPRGNTLYTLTVSGNGGTASCQTYTAGNYIAPITPVYQAAAVAPYIALTQIPYTGFDFGTFGNAIYWTLLALFAVALSYLVLYFRGGAFSLVASMVRGKGSRGNTENSRGDTLARQGVTSSVTSESRVTEETPSKMEGVTSNLGTDFRGTKDSMLSVGSTEGGVGPRIVVLRA